MRPEDVRDVVVAEVRDADDLALQLALAAGDRGAELRLQPLHDGRGIDARWRLQRASGRRRARVGDSSGMPSAAAAARIMAARVAAFSTSASTPPSLLDVVESGAERHDDGNRGRERRLAGRLGLALAAQVEIEARRACSGRFASRHPGSTARKARPGGSASDFWLPTTATSTPQASVSSAIAPAPEMASTTSSVSGRPLTTAPMPSMSCAAPVDDSLSCTNTPRIDGSASRAALTAAGSDRLAPLGVESSRRSCRAPCRSPPSARRSCRRRAPAWCRPATACSTTRRFHRAAARRGEQQHVVLRLQERLQPRRGVAEDLAELVGAVMDDRARHRQLDFRRQRRRAGSEESFLLEHGVSRRLSERSLGDFVSFHSFCGKACAKSPDRVAKLLLADDFLLFALCNSSMTAACDLRF